MIQSQPLILFHVDGHNFSRVCVCVFLSVNLPTLGIENYFVRFRKIPCVGYNVATYLQTCFLKNKKQKTKHVLPVTMVTWQLAKHAPCFLSINKKTNKHSPDNVVYNFMFTDNKILTFCFHKLLGFIFRSLYFPTP